RPAKRPPQNLRLPDEKPSVFHGTRLAVRAGMKRILLALLLTLPAAAVHADGKAIYDKSCKSCHADDGKGNAKMAGNLKIDAAVLNLGRDENKDLTRDQLKAVVSDGKNKMPAYGKKLAAADLDAALDYAMELAKTIRGGK